MDNLQIIQYNQFKIKCERMQENMKTADLCDEYADRLKLCKTPFHSYGKNKEFHGEIQTVQVYEDNVMVKECLETIKAGTVLVVDGGGSLNCALLGDRLAAIAAERDINGIIINGCVRDSTDLAGIAIGIKAIGTCPFKSEKIGKGSKGESLSFGEVEWIPGQYVYADDDGVIISDKPLHAKLG